MTSPENFARLVTIIADLRGENGCPWDKQQTHMSLKKDLLEETYEAIEAIEEGGPQKLKEELGDMLMVILLQVQIAKEEGEFDLSQVLDGIAEKLIRRHPHVFGDVDVENTDQIIRNWEAIKSQEESHRSRESLMDGVPKPLPALMAAQQIQKRAARVGFDWDNVSQMLPKLAEELDELKDAVENGQTSEIEMEFGDLLFSMVNLARFLGIDAEGSLRKANGKFMERFRQMERVLTERDEAFTDHDLEGLDRIWDVVKQNQN